MPKKWTIGLADGGRLFLAIATYIIGIDAWSVVLSIDGEHQQAVLTEDPCMVALQLIADAQLDTAVDLVVQE